MANVYLPISAFLNEFFLPFGKEVPFTLPEAWDRVLTAAFTPDANLRLPYTTVLLSAPKKCLAIGERVWLADGRFVPCEALVGESFCVWAWDGARFVSAPATAWVQGLKEVIQVRLWSGRTIRRTVGHRMMAWGGWREIETITPGQKIALPLIVPEPESPRSDITPELARFLGYMIGDGSLTGSSTPRFSQVEGLVLEDFRRCCTALGVVLRHVSGVDYSVSGNGAHLCRRFNLLGRNSYEHRVPSEIFQCGNKTIAEFLSALWAADGCAYVKPNGNGFHPVLEYCSMSEGLVDDIQALLGRFGIFPYKRAHAARGRRSDHCFKLTLSDRHDIISFAEQVGIVGKDEGLRSCVSWAQSRSNSRVRKVDQLCPSAWDDLRRAISDAGRSIHSVGVPVGGVHAPRRDDIAAIAAQLGADWLRDLALQPFAWDRVESVESLGVQETIGISVPGYGNHLAQEVTANSAKTTIAAGVALWFACCLSEPYGECIVAANKREQAKSRAFEFIRRAIDNHPAMKRAFRMQQNVFASEDGSKIYPVSTEAGGEAGANPELILHDEAWAMSSESDQRFWSELTTVPTRRNSIRVVTSYAGYLDYSHILYRLYEQAMKCGPHPAFPDLVDEAGQPVVRHDPDSRFFSYWETEQRMPWQLTPEGHQYYIDQQKTLRRSDFLRLHKNQWVSNEDGFDMDEWDACVDPDWDPNGEFFERGNSRLYIAAGADAAIRKDLSAVVTLFKREGRFWLGPYAIWQPSGPNFDFEGTVEAFIIKLKEKFRLREVNYDPYQLHRSAMTLRRKMIRMNEFKQTEPNTKLMGSLLCDLLRDRRLVIPDDPRLRHQAASTTLRLSAEGIQLKKDNRNLKIDAIIALAMAAVAAQHLPDVNVPISSQFVFV